MSPIINTFMRKTSDLGSYAHCGSKEISDRVVSVAFRGDSASEDRPSERRTARSEDEEIKACVQRVAALINKELEQFPHTAWNPHSPLNDFPLLIKWPKKPAKADGDSEEFRKNVMREVFASLKPHWVIEDSYLEGWCPK